MGRKSAARTAEQQRNQETRRFETGERSKFVETKHSQCRNEKIFEISYEPDAIMSKMEQTNKNIVKPI
jgi:hypothetical protein